MGIDRDDFTKEMRSSTWGRGLQHASDLLIKRGTVLGPMVPLLSLVPFLLGAMWLFREMLLFAIPLGIICFGIIFEYCRQYARFAKNDPDRLQSEQYRYEMKRMHMIAAKELPRPVPAEIVSLDEPVSNPAHPLPEVNESAIIEANREEK